jgi:hypothetical protein
MQEAQDSILAVCKGEETTVMATIVLLVKKRETNLILLRDEGNSVGCLQGPRSQGWQIMKQHIVTEIQMR